LLFLVNSMIFLSRFFFSGSFGFEFVWLLLMASLLLPSVTSLYYSISLFSYILIIIYYLSLVTFCWFYKLIFTMFSLSYSISPWRVLVFMLNYSFTILMLKFSIRRR
jgi:hypothetical protein